MKSRVFKIAASFLIGGLFLWLAFRSVDISELWDQIKHVSFYWVPFFVVAMVFSHFLRALRWRLLFPESEQSVHNSTLFAGVMLGYIVNNFVPRLGELSRPVYVAKKEKLSSGNLIGTIVAERLFDLFTMFFLIIVTSYLLVSDVELLKQVFGVQNWSWKQFLWIPVSLTVIVIGIVIFWRFMVVLDQKNKFKNPILLKFIAWTKSFGEGIVSLRRIKQWPQFILYTVAIWLGYMAMTYLPFYMMNMQNVYGLTPLDAVVLTMVSSIGVSVPTPAAVGSYHLFVQQSLWLLYGVPKVQGLTYATVTHATTVIMIFIIGPLALWWDKYHTLR